MRETRTSGSVGALGRNPQGYPACARRSLEREEAHVEELRDGNLLLEPGR